MPRSVEYGEAQTQTDAPPCGPSAHKRAGARRRAASPSQSRPKRRPAPKGPQPAMPPAAAQTLVQQSDPRGDAAYRYVGAGACYCAPPRATVFVIRDNSVVFGAPSQRLTPAAPRAPPWTAPRRAEGPGPFSSVDFLVGRVASHHTDGAGPARPQSAPRPQRDQPNGGPKERPGRGPIVLALGGLPDRQHVEPGRTGGPGQSRGARKCLNWFFYQL